jgi:hypothetical protein
MYCFKRNRVPKQLRFCDPTNPFLPLHCITISDIKWTNEQDTSADVNRGRNHNSHRHVKFILTVT